MIIEPPTLKAMTTHRGNIIDKTGRTMFSCCSFQDSCIKVLAVSLGGLEGLQIHLFEFPNFSVLKGGNRVDSFNLSAAEKRVLYNYLKNR